MTILRPYDAGNSIYSQDLFLAQNTGVASPISNLNTDNFMAKPSVKIYPNPFVNNLNISLQQNGIIEFFDTSGKFIAKEKLLNGANSINTSSMQKGIYLYQIKSTNGENLLSGKIIRN